MLSEMPRTDRDPELATDTDETGLDGTSSNAAGPRPAEERSVASNDPVIVSRPAEQRPSAELATEAHGDTAEIGSATTPGTKSLAVTPAPRTAPQGDRRVGPHIVSGEIMPPRRKRKRLLLLVVLLALIGGGGYFGFNWWTSGRFIVSTDDAYVAADMSMLAAKVPGLITQVNVTDNQYVTAGTLLARIDDGDYKLAVDAAQNRLDTQDATIARIGRQIDAQGATIAQAKAQLDSANAELVRAQSAYDRAQKLASSDYGTKASLDQARADRDKAKAGVAAAESAIASASAGLDVLKAQRVEAIRSRAELATALDRAKRDLSFTEIRAPFSGVVGNRAVEVGQYVQTGTRVMALVPLDAVRIDANLKETQLAEVKPGQPVDIKVDAFGGRVFKGFVDSVSPASGSLFSLLPPENATGNFTKIVQRLAVRIVLPPEVIAQRILRPGMSVVISINTRQPGTHVIGEDIPTRVALLFTRAKDAALRMVGVATAEPSERRPTARVASP